MSEAEANTMEELRLHRMLRITFHVMRYGGRDEAMRAARRARTYSRELERLWACAT